MGLQVAAVNAIRMLRGMYIAASGMMSDMVRQDVIAQNLANVSTVAYKRDEVANESFRDMFLTNVANGNPVGKLSLGTNVAGIITDFAQGAMRPTGEQFDLALSGDGLFAVQTGMGIAYTRNGQFQVAPNGMLTTQRGDLVLGTNGQPIMVGNREDINISPDGTVRDGQEILGRIQVATLEMESARKVGDGLWVGRVTGRWPAGTEVRQGYLEASSVNSITEMVRMIQTMRSYESSQRAMMSMDSTLEKAVSQVGSVQG